MSVELLAEADFARIKRIAEERFRNAADFKFFFVGKIDTSQLKPLVEKYIGGIPIWKKKRTGGTYTLNHRQELWRKP